MKSLFTFLFLVFAQNSYANQVVQIIWPFSAASTQANMVRALINEANGRQNNYKFVFVHKPGAGGSIAANASLSTETSILMSTSSFYIRPLLYKDSHDISKFDLIEVACSDQPLAIFSTRYSGISEIKIQPVTIGVIPGSITNLVSRRLSQENRNISEVFYKGTPEATADVLGGHLDLSIDFLGEQRITGNPRIKILGITGVRSYGNYKTLSEQNINGFESITNSYYIFVDKKLPSELKSELRKIFSVSKQNTTVQEICKRDYGQQIYFSESEINTLHLMTNQFWKTVTVNMTIK
jgi:tripartite-type tricarboxylate transporter receptor subunit TctC